MIKLRNIIELLSILIIIMFLNKKSKMKNNDKFIFILIILFIFLIYDYASGNKSCPKIESFSNSEPCNIKDIENMFDKYISRKKENLKILSTKENLEEKLQDVIKENINKTTENKIEEKNIEEEILKKKY